MSTRKKLEDSKSVMGRRVNKAARKAMQITVATCDIRESAGKVLTYEEKRCLRWEPEVNRVTKESTRQQLLSFARDNAHAF